MRVLIPELAEDAATLATALVGQGHEVVAIPAITIAPSSETAINLTGAQAFLVASPVAARALAARVGVRTFPVFADSAVTADALRRLGFKQVEAANDARDLANIVGNRLKPATGALIHPCAAGTPSNLTAVLTNMGFAVRPLPLYTLTRIDTAPPELREALSADTIDAAVFTTAEAARALVTVLQRSELSTKARGISALAATTTVAAPLRGLNLLSITIPAQADEAGLVAAMVTVETDRAKAAQAAATQEQNRLEAERAATLAAEEEQRKQEAAAAAEQERKRVEAEQEAARAVEREQKRREAEHAAVLAAEEEQRKQEAAAAAEQERKRVEAEREQKRREAEHAAVLAAEEERRKQEAAAAAEQERKRVEAEQEAARAAEREQKRLAAEQERKRLEAEQEAAAAAERERKRLEAERAAAEAAAEEQRKREAAEAAERERKQLEAERIAAAQRWHKEHLESQQAATRAAEEEKRKRDAAEAAEQERKRIEAEREAAAASQQERERLARERAAAQVVAEERRKQDAAAAAERERKRLEAVREAAAEAQREQERLEAKLAAARVAEEAARRAAEEARRERQERERLESARQKAEREAMIAAQHARDQKEAERAAERAAQQAQQERETAEAAERERQRIAAAFAETLASRQAQKEMEAAEVALREQKRQEAERERRAALARAEAERLEALRRADEEAAQAQREATARERADQMRRAASRPVVDATPVDVTPADTPPPEPIPSRADETLARESSEHEPFAHRIGRWLRRRKSPDQEPPQIRNDDTTDEETPPGAICEAPPIPASQAVNIEKPKQDDLLPSAPIPPLRSDPPHQGEQAKSGEVAPHAITATTSELTVPEPPPSVRLEPRPMPEPDLPVTPPGTMTQDHTTPAADEIVEPPAPAGATADAAPPRQRGRAARLQAEDAADAVRAPRWRGFADAPESPPRDIPLDKPVPRRSVRPGAVLMVLFILAVAATAPVWLPRLMLLRHGSVSTPVNVVAAPANSVPPLTANEITALRQETDQKQAAANAGRGEAQENAATPLGDIVGNQAKQLAVLTARVATLESALGNTAHLDELNRRLSALEGKSAEAASVLALADRVSTLEAASRGAIAAQTARVALVLAIAQWRDALADGRPFTLELESVKALADRATETLTGLDDTRFTSHAAAGIATTALLRERFDDTASSVLRAAAVPGGFNGFWGRSVERMMSIITIRRMDGLVEGNAPSAILARAGAFLKDGNLAAAVTEMEQLDGSAAAAAQPWLDEAHARVAAEQAVATATNTALGGIAAPTPQ